MVIDIAELRIDHRQTFEIVPNVELIGHAHAAMELNRLLTNETPGLADLHFCA